MSTKDYLEDLTFTPTKQQIQNRLDKQLAIMWVAGVSVLEIAERLNVSDMYVYKKRQLLGLESRHVSFTKEQEAEIAEYYKTHTSQETAEKYGIGKTRVDYIKTKYGIKKNQSSPRKTKVVRIYQGVKTETTKRVIKEVYQGLYIPKRGFGW